MARRAGAAGAAGAKCVVAAASAAGAAVAAAVSCATVRGAVAFWVCPVGTFMTGFFLQLLQISKPFPLELALEQLGSLLHTANIVDNSAAFAC